VPASAVRTATHSELGFRVAILIADPQLRRCIAGVLANRDDVLVEGVASSGAEASAILSELGAEIVLLQNRLGRDDAFEVLAACDSSIEARALVVLSTDPSDALRAFEFGAADFLLLPYTRARFATALERALARVREARMKRRERTPIALSSSLPALEREPPSRRLLVRCDGHWTVISVYSIRRIVASGNYAEIFCCERTLRVRSTVQALEEKLDPTLFFRVHRSTIVRLDQVEEVFSSPQGDYELTLHGGLKAVLARTRRGPFFAALEGLATARIRSA